MRDVNHFVYGMSFQLDLLKMMVDNLGFLLICKKYVPPEYFSSEQLKNFCGKIYKFHDKYGNTPDKTFMFSIAADRKEKFLLRRLFRPRTIKESYIRDKVEMFVKQTVFVDVFERSGELYNKQKIEESFSEWNKGTEQIQRISMKEDDYGFLFKDFQMRQKKRQHNLASLKTFKVPIGIRGLDYVTKGGVSGGEVAFWMGDAKSGKTHGLKHVALAAVKRYITTLFIQLEGSQQQMEDQFDAANMHVLYDDVKNNEIPRKKLKMMLKMAERRRYRELILRHFSDYDSCDILDIERDLISLRNRGFDIKLVVIDYFDLLSSRKVFRKEDEMQRQKQNSRDLKTFAVKNNVAVWTATQTNRYIENEDPNFIITSKNAAEDYNKIRALDLLFTLNATPEERKANTMRIWFDMGREQRAGRLFRIKTDFDHSRFYVRKKKI